MHEQCPPPGSASHLPNLLNCRADLLIKGVTPAARREKYHGVLTTVGCCGVIRLRVSPQGAQRKDGYGGVLRTVGTEYVGCCGVIRSPRVSPLGARRMGGVLRTVGTKCSEAGSPLRSAGTAGAAANRAPFSGLPGPTS